MLKTVSSITNAIGALNYKGTWDANANSPALASSVGTKGDYYVVGTAGSTNLNGISNWGVGDWAAYNGSAWQRVEGGANLNGVDLSVSGTSTLSGLTASTALALNASKEVVSVTNTGTGDNVLATAPTLVGNATLSTGNLIFSASGKGIQGTTTNDSADTGVVGEFVSSNVSNTAVTLTTGVTANLTSISLTAGDWDVQGNVGFDTAATANLTYWYAGVTTVSATLQNGYYQATNSVAPTGGAVFGANAFSLPSPVARISLSATTTVYLITNVGFTVAAVKAGGMIKARRVR